MAAAAVALPAYVLGRTSEIATRRVENDFRQGEPGLGDMAAAAPAAMGEALLERFATRALPGLGRAPGASAPARIASQTGIQAGTEAVEEGIANLGESLGTQRGVDAGELGNAMLEGAIVGGGLGGGAQTGAEAVNAVRARGANTPVEARAQESRLPTADEILDSDASVAAA
jgi:hypothetical protein